ncbi:hypothetical protein [Phenylobacterium sp.]|uniref:hypothetical protein n=1 Tax=Phenylobacterium sp. TaxID=1871053 RepID=UPI0035AF2997
MALPVRPAIMPATPVAPRADTARLAAQKAFFQAALGQPQAAAAPAAPAQTQAAAPAQTPAPATPAQRTAAAPEEPPKRIPRPGTYLDIRV